jgi:hypothetical protein
MAAALSLVVSTPGSALYVLEEHRSDRYVEAGSGSAGREEAQLPVHDGPHRPRAERYNGSGH